MWSESRPQRPMSHPPPNYTHLLELVDDNGIFEHCRYDTPRREHGYTLDDASRAIVVLCHGPDGAPIVRAMDVLLGFLLASETAEGRFHNRLSADRRWLEDESSDDAQGRAVWALGVAATMAPRAEIRNEARLAVRRVPVIRSDHLRPYAYAALGAHALWKLDRDDPEAWRLMYPIAEVLRAWETPWPEHRFTYANGRIPAGMLAAGEMLGDMDLIGNGLETLSWLDMVESGSGRLSPTPAGGWGPGDPRPAFDQQPIEAAALADAAERAWLIDGDEKWRETVFRCGDWLLGENDVGIPLYDTETGATHDGLERNGVNANRGAESTIAGLSILQTCQRMRTATAATLVGRVTSPD